MPGKESIHFAQSKVASMIGGKGHQKELSKPIKATVLSTPKIKLAKFSTDLSAMSDPEVSRKR